VIKYLGSKRRLVPVLAAVREICGARTALDLFTGTTRVAQAWRSAGATVTAVDSARYAAVLAETYVATDLTPARRRDLDAALADLAAVPPAPGYVTEVFCRTARYFQPANGERIDAIRAAIAERYTGTWLEPVLLTALLEAADRVDSTTGVQMAFLKAWAPRAHRSLDLRPPVIPDGPPGGAVRADATEAVHHLPPVDLAYLDPPYNQHRYTANYHVWETIVRWDAPAYYGVACKRADLRGPDDRSAFNERARMPGALASCVKLVDAAVVVVSYNDESWVSLDELVEMCATRGPVTVLSFDSRRYVGATIGIHDPSGKKVGTVSHTRNTEYVLVAGDLSAGQRRRLAALSSSPSAASLRPAPAR
jgi:adenine-specific DNA-methyltransferase